jgi:hypothetical protein
MLYVKGGGFFLLVIRYPRWDDSCGVDVYSYLCITYARGIGGLF